MKRRRRRPLVMEGLGMVTERDGGLGPDSLEIRNQDAEWENVAHRLRLSAGGADNFDRTRGDLELGTVRVEIHFPQVAA